MLFRSLTTRSRAEVLASYEDAAPIGRIIEHEVFIHRAVGLIPPVAEQIITEEFLFSRRCFQEACGYDLVCVHILQRQWHTGTRYYVKLLFHILFILARITRIHTALFNYPTAVSLKELC